jgi:hypothetical protein
MNSLPLISHRLFVSALESERRHARPLADRLECREEAPAGRVRALELFAEDAPLPAGAGEPRGAVARSREG